MPYPQIQYSRLVAARKKNCKIKEIDESQVLKRAPSKNGPYHGETQQPKRA
jgi:hypothetical protein